MLKKKLRNCIVKIPDCIICYYCNTSNSLLIKGKFGYKFLKLDIKILLLVKENLIILTFKNCKGEENYINVKWIKSIQSRTNSLIKAAFLDVSWKFYKKLKLYGVGFRIIFLELSRFNLLKFTLGYSHNVYFKLPLDIVVTVNSPTKMIISGHSKEWVSAVSSQIRRLKIPEPYKGKGILYDNEIIKLKSVKKV